jgi:hypothetical protein
MIQRADIAGLDQGHESPPMSVNDVVLNLSPLGSRGPGHCPLLATTVALGFSAPRQLGIQGQSQLLMRPCEVMIFIAAEILPTLYLGRLSPNGT